MFRHSLRTSFFVILLMLSSWISVGSYAFAQFRVTRPNSGEINVPPLQSAVSEPTRGRPDHRGVTDETRSMDLADEVKTLKHENAAIRELLRKMDEHQKILLEHV